MVSPFARPGALAKAVFVAIACEEAITLCGLRKLVSTVSCCSALKARNAAGRTQSWRQLHFDHYHFALYHIVLCHSRAHFAVTPNEVLAKRSRARRVLKTEGTRHQTARY